MTFPLPCVLLLVLAWLRVAGGQPGQVPAAFTSWLLPLAAAVQQPGTSPEALPEILRQLAQLEVAGAPPALAWLPAYYQAYGNIRLAFLAAPDAARQDALLDLAQQALAQAQACPAADAAEVLVLQAYLHQARLTVAPFARALRYSARTREALGQARLLAPANPRLYLVWGNDDYYKPRLLGGGKAAALARYQQAQVYFATFRPATAASPSWGAAQTRKALARCRP